MKMTTEQFVQKCHEAARDNLVSVVLYGSTAAEERTNKFSDVNILIVLKKETTGDLAVLRSAVEPWVRAGNPPPLLFSSERLKNAEDVFPVEFLDIKAAHRILFGQDPFVNLSVPTVNLRHQIEYELRGRRLQLARLFISTKMEATLAQTLAKAVSSTLVLFRAVLRLVNAPVPARREEVPAALKKYVDIDVPGVLELLNGRESVERSNRVLLENLDKVIEFVDQYTPATAGREETK